MLIKALVELRILVDRGLTFLRKLHETPSIS